MPVVRRTKSRAASPELAVSSNAKNPFPSHSLSLLIHFHFALMRSRSCGRTIYLAFCNMFGAIPRPLIFLFLFSFFTRLFTLLHFLSKVFLLHFLSEPPRQLFSSMDSLVHVTRRLNTSLLRVYPFFYFFSFANFFFCGISFSLLGYISWASQSYFA